MLSDIDGACHIDLPGMLLILERAALIEGIKRGKAYKRREAMRKREARAAAAAECKREERTS